VKVAAEEHVMVDGSLVDWIDRARPDYLEMLNLALTRCQIRRVWLFKARVDRRA
jgi:hypothetical protein